MIHTLRSVPSSGNRVEKVIARKLGNNKSTVPENIIGIFGKVAGYCGSVVIGITLINLLPLGAHERVHAVWRRDDVSIVAPKGSKRWREGSSRMAE